MKLHPIDDGTLAPIRDALASDDPAERAQAIDALGILGDERGLADGLAHDDAYVRRSAVRSLAGVAGERHTWRLAHMIFDPDVDVRCAVVRALARRGGIGGWLVAHALRRVVEQDEAPGVRFLALTSLDELDAANVVAVLHAASADDPESLVRETARALLVRRGLDPGPASGGSSGPASSEGDEP